MIDSVRFEWVRLLTLRSTWWLTGLSVGLGLLISGGTAFAFRSELSGGVATTPQDAEVLPVVFVSQGAAVFVPFLAAFMLAMIGVFAWGHEYRHGMIRATLTAQPVRARVWAAKVAVVGAWALTWWLVGGLLSIGVSALVLSGAGLDVVTGSTWAMLWRCALFTVLLTWVALAFTAIVRAQVSALVLLFVWPFLIENILSTLVNTVGAVRDVLGPATRFLPFEAGNRIIKELDLGMPGAGTPLTALQGFAVFGGFCGLLLAASLVLLNRRDA